MLRRTPRSTLTVTLVPYTTLFRSGRVVHDAVDVDAWQVHVVRVDGADLDDLFDLDDADLARHRAGRVEVARSLAEQQVAGLVGLPGLDQRHVDRKSTRLNSSH